MDIASNGSCIAGVTAIHGHKKTPHPFPGAGFSKGIQVGLALPGHVPSARTSAGNKEYEYKKEKEFAVNAQQASKRRGTIHCEVEMAVALRHAVDPKAFFWGLSTTFVKIFAESSGDGAFGRPDVQMASVVEALGDRLLTAWAVALDCHVHGC
jgi:hypothetical protein